MEEHEAREFYGRSFTVVLVQINYHRGQLQLANDLLERGEGVLSVMNVLGTLGSSVAETYDDALEDAAGAISEDILDDQTRRRWEATAKSIGADFDRDYADRVEIILQTLRETSQSMIRSKWAGFCSFCEASGANAHVIAEKLAPGVAAEYDAIEEPLLPQAVDETREFFESAEWQRGPGRWLEEGDR